LKLATLNEMITREMQKPLLKRQLRLLVFLQKEKSLYEFSLSMLKKVERDD
jgi:hypothetical protein